MYCLAIIAYLQGLEVEECAEYNGCQIFTDKGRLLVPVPSVAKGGASSSAQAGTVHMNAHNAKQLAQQHGKWLLQHVLPYDVAVSAMDAANKAHGSKQGSSKQGSSNKSSACYSYSGSHSHHSHSYSWRGSSGGPSSADSRPSKRLRAEDQVVGNPPGLYSNLDACVQLRNAFAHNGENGIVHMTNVQLAR